MDATSIRGAPPRHPPPWVGDTIEVLIDDERHITRIAESG
jgi:hypothetical protein